MRTISLSERDSHYQQRRRAKRPTPEPVRAKLALARHRQAYQSDAMMRLLECLEAGSVHGLGTLTHAAETLGIVAILPQVSHDTAPEPLSTLIAEAPLDSDTVAYYWHVLKRDGETEQCRVLLQKMYTAVCTLPRAMDAYQTLTRMAHVNRAGAQARFNLSAGNWAQWVTHSLAWLAAQCAHRFSDVSVDVDANGNAPALPYLLYDEQEQKQARQARQAWQKVYRSEQERLPRKVYKERRDMEQAYQDSLAAPAVYSALAGTSPTGKPYTARKRKVG